MSPKRATESDARQRILETADRLFYRDGFRGVGIDRIIAEADIAKATLYAHFASKDDLILAALQHREESLREFFRAAVERHGKRHKDRLRAFFASLKDLFASPGFRGCPFQNAAAELADPAHPGSVYVRGQKQRFAAMVRGFIAESAGERRADECGSAVALLVEGAIVNAVLYKQPEAADVAYEAARQLIGAK
jgi:AcrR family transcriptional regulator